MHAGYWSLYTSRRGYRQPSQLSVGSDTENQPNQKFPADVTIKNAANLTLDELQVSLALSELMLLNTAKSPGARTSISPPREYYRFGAGAEQIDEMYNPPVKSVPIRITHT